MAWVLTVVGLVVPISLSAAPAQAASTDLCSSSYAPASSYSAVPTHGQVFYIDSGVTPKVDAAYAGYKFTNNTGSAKTFWVSLENFSGGAVDLVNPADHFQQISSLASGSTDTVFFLLKATAASATAQKHVVKVYDKRPDLSGAAVQFSCYYSFSKVAETIKASANKVTAVTTSLAPAIATLGGKLTVTVTGDTGKIGAGSAPDTDIIWVSPAAVSSWPTRSLRLIGTSITLNCSGKSNLVLTDELYYATPVADCYGQGASGTWSGVYTFQIIGPSQTTVPIRPVAQISSGTQVKHSDITTAPANIDLSGVASTSVTLSKTASSTFDTSTSTSARVTYTVTLSTNSTTDITVDEIIDTPQSGTSFVTGSATITDVGRSSVAIPNPTFLASESALSPRPQHYTGPFTLKSTQNAILTYKMDVPCSATPTAYSNSAYVKAGDQIIGASATTMPVAKVTTTAGGSSCTGTTETTTVTVTPSAQTAPASAIDTATATLNGFANAYGQAGVTAYFTYGTSSTLTSGNSTTSSIAVSGSSAVAQSAVLTGLTPNTRYYFRMDVPYSGGVSKGSILYFDTLPQQATPTVITQPATGIAAKAATLNGSINPNVTNVIKVDFIWATTANWPNSTTTTTVQVDDGSATLVDLQLTGATPQSVSTALTNLSSTTSYTFKVRAWCDTTNMGSYCSASPNNFVDGDTLTFTTGKPSVTTSDATVVAATTVTMNGSVDGNSTATSTYYEYCASGATCSASSMTGTLETTTSTSRASSFNDVTPVNVTGLTAGTTYYFRNVASAGGTLYRGAILSFKTLKITTTSLPNGNVNTAYAQGLVGTGGSSGYTWAVTTGSLPAGLTLDPNSGLISGTPTGSETQTFTVTMTDVGFTTTTTQQYTIVISAAGQTITFAAITDREYGSGNVVTSPTADSGLTVTLTSNSTDTCTVSTFTVTLKAVGTCSLTATQAGNGSFSAATPVTRTFNITKKALTVTGLSADNKVYNGSDTATVTGTPTLNGVLTADSTTVSVTLGASTFSSATVANGKTVTPTLTLSGAASGNYSVTTPSLTANITAVTVTITASSPTTTYGTAVATVNASVTPSYSGFVNGESQAVLTSAPTCSVPTYTVTTNAGTTPASSCTGAAATNYTFSYNSGSLTINKRTAALTVTAKTVTVGSTLDTSTIQYDIDDTSVTPSVPVSVSAFSGITCSTTYLTSDPVTETSRTMSCSGGTATNYNITVYNPGAVTISAATAKAVITFPAIDNKKYTVETATPSADVDATSKGKGWQVSYTSHDATVCDYDAATSTIKIKKVGLCKVQANSVNAANDNSTIAADPVITEFDVLPDTVTLTATAHVVTYGDAAPTITLESKSGFRNGETETVLSGFACTTTYSQGASAGQSYETSCDGSNPNYVVAKVKKTVTVNKRTLTATPTVIDKVYDGNDTATVSTVALGNKYGSDDVYADTSTITANFASSSVDTYTVVVQHNSGFLKGSTAGNYQIADTSTATLVRITKRPVTPSITVADKVYDGDTSTVLSAKTLTDKVAGDDVDFDTSTVAFASPNVSDAQAVTTSALALTGTKAGNYTLNSLSGVTGRITKKTLTVNPVVPDKTYDGTTSAVLQSASLTGIVNDDDVAVDTTTVSVSFPSADVDTLTVVVPQNGLSFLKGAKKGNYQVAASSNATAKILPREVTPSLTLTDKVYDGETTTVVASTSLSNKVSGDDVDIETATVVFASPDVNDSQTVNTGSLTLKGAKAGNYTLAALSGVTGKITPRPVTPTIAVQDKVYNGDTTTVVTTKTLSWKYTSDDVDIETATVAFASADVNDSQTVNTGGLTLKGAKAGNYSLNALAGVTGKITKRPLTPTLTVADKVYDGETTTVIASTSLSNTVPGDDVDIETATVTFSSPDVSNTRSVITSNLTLKGAKAGNYSLNALAGVTGKITKRPLTGTITVLSKEYDGDTSTVIVSGSITAGGVVGSDDVSIDTSTTTAAFDSPDVNANRSVSVSSVGIKGGKSGNYSISHTGAVAAAITPRVVTPVIAVQDKEYDGETSTVVTTRTLTRKLASDDVELETATVVFSSPDVSNTQTVVTTALSLKGAKAGNYKVETGTAVTGKITPKTLTVTAVIADKIYDDSVTATLQSASLTGIVKSDDVAVDTSTVSVAFPSADVDTLTVTVPQNGASFLKGSKKNNYRTADTSTATAKILPRPITISVETQTVRRGQALGAFTVTPNAGGLVSGHTLTCTVTASVDTMTVGTYANAATIANCTIDKPVAPSGFGLAAVGLAVAPGTDKTANYAQVYLSGAVIVTDKYIPNIAWDSPTVLTYGDTLTATRLSAKATHSTSGRAANEVLGSYVYKRDTQTVTSATVLDAGAYDLDVEFTPDAPDSDSYTAMTARRPVTVNKKSVTVRAQDLTIDAGGACTFTATVTGLVGSETLDTFTYSGQNCATAGSYAVTPSGGAWGNGGKLANYNVTYIAGTLTVRGVNNTTTNNGGGGRGYQPPPTPAPKIDEKEVKVTIPNGGAVLKPKELDDSGDVQKLVTPSNKPNVIVSLVPGVNGIKVEAPPAFSGKVTAQVETLKDGTPTLVTTIITIPPAEAKDPASTNNTLYTSTVAWKKSPSDVIRYEVEIDGKVLCSTKETSCRVKKTISPDTDVKVTAIGNDDTTSQPEVAAYKPNYVVATVVRFDENKSTLKPNAVTTLVTTARRLKETGFTHLYVAGYTDAQGGTKNAKALSTARAKKVVTTLTKLVPGIKVTMIDGKGLQNPVASNKTKKGQSLNRRAQVYVRY